MRLATLLLLIGFAIPSIAGSGGPDTYGYTWKDSNEPGGPVFNWLDITTSGQLISGLADDNVVGPVTLTTNFPYYWYAPKKVWIGSNGYIAFENTNLASPFPLIPNAGGGNDYITGLMADLNFAGAGNPAQCFLLDTGTVTIISYINVPFWSPTAPGGFSGSNTFQIILDRADSTITVQYQSIMGTTQNNDVTIGIESITGDIGLMHSSDVLPPSNYAIRYYNPANPLLQVTDANCNWLTSGKNVGHMRALGGGPFEMVMNAKNTGNQPLSNFEMVGEVQNASLVQMVSDTQTVTMLNPSTDTTVFFGNQFTPAVAGTYRYIGRVNNIANELVLTNNIQEQELHVYDTTAAALNLGWAGGSDDGVGLGWSGGNGGIGVFIDVPMHPAYVAATTIRIASNTGAGMHMKVFDDDGPGGSRGTLLDSVFVTAGTATPGNHTIPLANPFILTDGGLYVEWQMGADGVNIARDIVSPFSRQTYEVLGGVWAEYRDRETEDFHLGLRITQLPITDGGCTQFFGILPGSTVGQPTAVRSWVKNFGNQVLSGFDMKYQFDTQAIVTQPFAGTLSPGDSVLFTFNTLLDPVVNATGDLCTWTSIVGDMDVLNDTNCINISLAVGLEELDAQNWQVGPVPTSDVLRITPPSNVPYALELFDITGALILNSAGRVTGVQEVDVQLLESGVYLLMVRVEGNAIAKRIVKR
jgi:hypothetical protein